MEFNILYSSNDIRFDRKPTKKQYESLKFSYRKADIKELISHLTSGKSITGGVFKNNYRSGDNFASQQLFGVDFDNKITLNEVDGILQDYGLNYNFGYYTLRHTDTKPRFRIYFVLDGEVRDPNLTKDILKSLHHLFDQKSDSNAVDVARVWLGTNKSSFYGDLYSVTPLHKLVEAANFRKFGKDRCQTRSLLPMKMVYNMNCANADNPIYYKYKSIHDCTEHEIDENVEREVIKNFDLNSLFECKLFKIFYDGLGTPTKGNKLIHNELLGIASNLLQLSGGMKIFKDAIARNRAYSKDKASIINYLKRKNSLPINFSDFSPFEEDQNNQFQNFSQLLRKRGLIKTIDTTIEPNLITESEASLKLKDAYDYIINQNTNKIYLLKVATGLGKTELLKNTKGIVIAFPDNALKQEQYISSKLRDEEKLITPSIEEIFSGKIKVKIKRMFAIGKNEQVIDLIKQIAEGYIDEKTISENDKNNAKEYLEKLANIKKAENLNKTIFTTHARAIFSNYPHKTLVFDENPLQQLFDVKKVSIRDLKEFARAVEKTGLIDELIKSMENDVCYNTPTELRTLIGKVNPIVALNIETNVFKFLESDYYIKDDDYVSYVINNLRKLPSDKKIIIADATASVSLWKQLVGDRLEVIEVQNVKLKGKIKQFTSRSCSREGLKKYHEKIASSVGSELCITFKSGKQYFEHASKEMHFGRLRGSNGLTGKKFSVVGTPHQNNFSYRFLASICDLKVETFTMKYDKIQYKNREFWFKTFEDPTLRLLHLELVEAEIVQAVDRARLIRNDVEITLYSNLPIDQATYMIM